MSVDKSKVKRPRNFWAEVDIDDQKTQLRGGPIGKYGGLTFNLYQRNHGGVDHPVKIECFEVDGDLFTEVYCNGELVANICTPR